LRRGKKYIFLLGLILTALLLGLLAAELTVRLLAPHSRDHVIPRGFLEMDHDLGWKLAAGQSVNHRSRYFGATYTSNTLGYRDKERRVEKGEGIRRILVYGDSRTFGWGVQQEKRFSNILEDRGNSLEVWNLGVPGYGLDQEIISYEQNGISLDADEIILLVTRATLYRTHHDRIYKKQKPIFVLDDEGELTVKTVPRHSFTRTSFFFRLLGSLYLPYFLELHLEILKEAFQKRDPAAESGSVPLLGEIQKGMLLRARKVAARNNQRLTVLTSHPLKKIEGLKEFCEENGIAYIEIDFGGEVREDLIIGKSDRHWNAYANELIARQLLSAYDSPRPERPEQETVGLDG
jgi:hypothetical protein